MIFICGKAKIFIITKFFLQENEKPFSSPYNSLRRISLWKVCTGNNKHNKKEFGAAISMYYNFKGKP